MSLIEGRHSFAVIPGAGHARPVEPFPVYAQENPHDRMQRVLQNSLNAQFRDHQYFRQYDMGDIVVLVGTSTAGKTSIIKALLELEPDRLEDGGDLRSYATNLKVMTKYNRDEIDILLNVMRTPLDVAKAVESQERSWKSGVSPQEQQEAEEAIKRIHRAGDSFSKEEKADIRGAFQNIELEMFDDAFERSRQGKTTIFDVLNIDALAQHVLLRKFKGPLRAVLTFCPFHVLSARMEQRNREAVENGELSNQRIGEFPLMQFGEVYTQRGRRQMTLERLTREQVVQSFDDNFDKGIESALERARQQGRQLTLEDILQEKKDSREKLLKNLGFTEGVDVVEIAPKNQDFYQMILNSSQSLPTASARLIHAGTHQRYHHTPHDS